MWWYHMTHSKFTLKVVCDQEKVNSTAYSVAVDDLLLCNSESITRESWQFKALFEFQMFHSVRIKERNLPAFW